jgi:putative membrane protein
MSGRAWLVVYLKGAAMGAADAVPGVSGGTIALITGIYERLVGAIAALDPAEAIGLLALVPRLSQQDAREEFWETVVGMDVPFLLLLGVGVLTSVITVANIVHVAINDAPGVTFAFFFGLIAASVVVLFSEVSVATPGRIAAAVVGFVFAFVVSAQGQANLLPSGLLVMFVAGAIAICAMVLPGVSGSLILITLGKYETMTSAVSEATDALFAGDTAASVDPLSVLVVFSVGALVGLLSFARVVKWALDNFRAATLTFLVALMAGALRAPAIRIGDANPEWTAAGGAFIIVAGLLGGGAVLLLDAKTDDLDY